MDMDQKFQQTRLTHSVQQTHNDTSENTVQLCDLSCFYYAIN